MIAAKENRQMIAERLLDMGADVNAAAKVRRTLDYQRLIIMHIGLAIVTGQQVRRSSRYS